MEREDEFDDGLVKQSVIDYFIANLNKSKRAVDKFICLPSFTVDDSKFCKGKMSIFDGYSLRWNNVDDCYNRYALVEVKERYEEYDSPLLEFKKIDKWLEHRDKWKYFYYFNLMPSGLWCLPVHNLKLWEWEGRLDEVKIDGVKPFKFDRNAPRKGGEVLNSDKGKVSLIIDKKHWIECIDYRRICDE